MTRFRRLCLFLGFVAFTGAFAFVARRIYAGPERISISCACANSFCGPIVIPVTVTMASDGPDYVDMVYTATDSFGNPVSCSPSSNRLYVAKGSPVTDNVTITCTSNTNFSATGTGETGGDTGLGQCTITCSGGGGCAESKAATIVHPAIHAAAASTTINFNQDNGFPSENWVWVMPIAIQLPPPSSGTTPNQDHVQLTYSATSSSGDHTTGNACTCVPALEFVNLDSRIKPAADVPAGDLPGLVMRHVAIRARKNITALALSVNAIGLQGGVVGTGQWSFTINSATGGADPALQNAGGGVLKVGYNPNTAAGGQRTLVQFVEHVVEVNPSLAANDIVRMKFLAQDVDSQALDCQPRVITASTLNPGPFYVLVKCKGAAAGTITLTAHAHSLVSGDLNPEPQVTFQK